MKKITLLLVMLLSLAEGAMAKNIETTLWEGSSVGGAEINLANSKFGDAKAGDKIRITFTTTATGSFRAIYKIGESDDWAAHTFNGIAEWPWVGDVDQTSIDLDINATDLTTLKTYGMYLYGWTEVTITKVALISEAVPTAETELLDANWTASWTAKTFAAQSGAKIGDVIRFTYNAPGGWSYFQFNILDVYGNKDAFTNPDTNVGTSIETAAELYFDFEITNIGDMQKIQNEGFGIKGDNFTLTSVKLLTYADSYDAVSVTIGADGIATWSHAKNLDFTGTGISAYYISAVAAGSVTLTATATTWNYCGYILKGSAGTYTVKAVADEDATYPAATYLKGNVSEGTVTASTSGTYHYIFAKNASDAIGFYKLTANHTLGANKAYLETDTDIAAADARVALVFDDGTTGVKELKNATTEEMKSCYNLAGQRVAEPTKGLYIVNGKKVIVK